MLLLHVIAVRRLRLSMIRVSKMWRVTAIATIVPGEVIVVSLVHVSVMRSGVMWVRRLLLHVLRVARGRAWVDARRRWLAIVVVLGVAALRRHVIVLSAFVMGVLRRMWLVVRGESSARTFAR